MSGQKFKGNLYIACGISGRSAPQRHQDASTIVAINNSPNAAIFSIADYGIVGNVKDIMPLLAEALDTGKPRNRHRPWSRSNVPDLRNRPRL